jgi:hypothetical protein
MALRSEAAARADAIRAAIATGRDERAAARAARQSGFVVGDGAATEVAASTEGVTTMGLLGTALTTLGGGLLRNLSKVNATPQQDWEGAVRVYGLAEATRRYPVQAAQFGVQPGSGTNYQLPVPYASQQAFNPPAQTAALPIAYTPTMATVPPLIAQGARALPQIGAAIGRVTGMLPASVRASLPTLSRRIAEASGWIVVGGLVYDAAGQLMGKTRRRRRVNPLNYRAAMRAVRRLHQLQTFNTRLEQCLPTRKTSRKTWPKRKRKSCP